MSKECIHFLGHSVFHCRRNRQSSP